jgi:cytochrome c
VGDCCLRTPEELTVKSHTIAAVAGGALLLCGPAVADMALAMQSGCLGCHQMDKKLIGPAFREVAARYAADAGIVETLAAKVKAGSTPGEPLNWGSMAMPPSPAPLDDIRKVIAWVLTPP